MELIGERIDTLEVNFLGVIVVYNRSICDSNPFDATRSGYVHHLLGVGIFSLTLNKANDNART